MTDPISTIGLGAVAAYLAKDGVAKLLGPTAEYLGVGLKEFTKKRADAVGTIFSTAYRKLGSKSEQPGVVPPKVLKLVINEGSYANDTLAFEYFGGVLASARTEDGRDDRCARLAKTIDGLSTYQLRAHYLIYSTCRLLFAKSGFSFDMHTRPKMQCFVPLDGFMKAMDLTHSEQVDLTQLFSHIFHGLDADGLIGPTWRYGMQPDLVDLYSAAPTSGVLFEPSALGVELYLAAFGFVGKSHEFLFSSTFSSLVEGVAGEFPNSIATKI
jgi:hypothetical protein